MLGFISGVTMGIISASAMVINLIFWGALFYCVLIFKLLVKPFPVSLQLAKHIDSILVKIAELWIYGNAAIYLLCFDLSWDIQVPAQLKRDTSYLVASNHQSWVDILVLQKMFTGKIPFLRFFLKQELIWLPILGLAWWGLDMPFMKRYSREYLAKNPHMRGKDMQTTRESCAKFKLKPVSIINFFEGTRYSAKKHAAQQSPFENLLKPRAGGCALSIEAMDGIIKQLLLVTIVYPNQKLTLKHFLYNQTRHIIGRAELIDIPPQFIGGDYENDAQFKAKFQNWVNELWQRQEQTLKNLKSSIDL